MDGKQIIDKIIADAEAQAENIVSEAIKKATEITDKAEEQCQKMTAQFEEDIQNRTKEIFRSRETVADLDIKKQLLGMRRSLIDQVFDGVGKEIRKLDKKQYLSIISGMIKQNAEDGDQVVICEQDQKIITKEFISDTAKKLGITLTLCPEYGSFEGGIMLRAKGVDKNLTIEVETATLREQLETQIAQMLFS